MILPLTVGIIFESIGEALLIFEFVALFPGEGVAIVSGANLLLPELYMLDCGLQYGLLTIIVGTSFDRESIALLNFEFADSLAGDRVAIVSSAKLLLHELYMPDWGL